MVETKSVELGMLNSWVISCLSNNKNGVVKYVAMKDRGGQNMPLMVCDKSLENLKYKLLRMGR